MDPGETLARSQLALLYRLGVLEQEAGDVENDPHAFLNRLPPPAPAQAPLQASGERVGRVSGVAAWKDASRVAVKTPTRVPLSQLSAASLGTRQPVAGDPPRVLLQRWFAVWKGRLQTKWHTGEATIMGQRRTKARVLRRWQTAVYHERLVDARCRQLQCWRMRRRLRAWAAPVAQQRCVTQFIAAHEPLLVLRIRQARRLQHWRRWVQWRQEYIQRLARAETMARVRRLRRLWIEWRITMLQTQRRHVVYRGFFALLQRERSARSHRNELGNDRFALCMRNRMQRVVRRWRVFNDWKQREHVRVWRVRMVLERGKFFTIWYTALQHKRRIQPLQARVQYRVLRDHLCAWQVTAQALTLSRSSTLWHPEAICARYWSVWTQWTRESIRFRHATNVIHARQQRRAVRTLRMWTIEHTEYRKQNQTAEAITRRRILRYVWENGWLVKHLQRQHDKLLTKRVREKAAVRVFGIWLRVWCVRHAWREKKAIAKRMGLKKAVQNVWDAWRRHTRYRRIHKHQLLQATRHYDHRRLLVGLLALSKIVDRKCVHAMAARRIRVAHRMALTRRVLSGWRQYTQHKATLLQRLEVFTTRPAYRSSLWNPLRRSWRRWHVFLEIHKQVQELQWRHEDTIVRRNFQAWKRRAYVHFLARIHSDNRQHRCCRAVLAVWKQCVDERRRVNELKTRAQDFYRRVFSVKVLCAWRRVVVGRLRRIRRQQGQLQAQYRHQLARRTLSRWHRRLRQSHGVNQLAAQRRRVWLRVCLEAWRTYHAHQIKYKRKLGYYRQVFGAYPATSPFRRLWNHWKALAVLGATATQLRRRSQQRGLRSCFAAWKTFRMAKLILRSWHTLSVVTSATTNDLGKRLRLFRQQCGRRQLQRCFAVWASVTQWRQRQQARIGANHRRLVREIPLAQADRRKRRRWQLKLWFQRWRRRQLASLHYAVYWHDRRHCHRILYAWWRQVIHNKQERVLQAARQTVGMMSAHRRLSQPPPLRHHAMETGKTIPNRNSRALPQAKKREPASVKRMVDPTPSSNSYQQQLVRPKPLPRKDEVVPCRKRPVLPSVRSSDSRFDAGGSEEIPTPVIRTQPRNPSYNVAELPLFDTDEALDPPTIDATEPIVTPSDPTPPPTPLKTDGGYDLPFSLESIAAMDPYSPVRPPRQPPSHPLQSKPSLVTPPRRQATPPRRQDSETRTPTRPLPEPTLFTPAQSLRPRGATTSVSKPLKASTLRERPRPATQELADLLEIPQNQAPIQRLSAFRAVVGDADDSPNQIIDVDRVVTVIVDHYEKLSVPNEGWLEATGFCMLRDLGLFASAYFLGAMERAITRVRATGHQALRDLLCEFIMNHPQYLFHTSKATQEALDPLGWLVRSHLVRRHGQAALMRTNRPFWIRHALPQDVVVSLPKLLKCIRKYQQPLESFFAWRPQSTTRVASRGRMDSGTFLLLLKHSNVYPQLFDRRDVESAVLYASTRLHDKELQLTIPEFVEALVRCALQLKWVHNTSSATDQDLVVVVKFLMLIFAMEGRGSMLTKRSQDLDVVMRFLERQQNERHAKADKLRRFQGLLRAEASVPKPRERKEPSAFRTAMASHEYNVKSPRDFTRTTDRNESPQYQARPSERDGRVSPSPMPIREAREEKEVLHRRGSDEANSPRTVVSAEHDKRVTPTQVEAESNPSLSDDTPGTGFAGVRVSSISASDSSLLAPSLTDFTLQQTMVRDAFLNDILSSLHDVELLLQQSDGRRPTVPTTSGEDDVVLTSEPFSPAYPERYGVLNGQLPTEVDTMDASQPIDDIHVNDPLLDYLTFADRFSESQDWESHLSIAGLAAHGIHAAFPSALHVRTTLKTSELDDLTDPQRTAAHLRADRHDSDV